MTEALYESNLPVFDDGTAPRVLAALPPYRMCALPEFSAAFEQLPESEWKDCSLKQWKAPIWDQGQFGSCVGQAAGCAFTNSWLQSGQKFNEFSPTSIYARINGGRDQGSVVSDALICLKTYGIALMSQFGQNQIYQQQITPTIANTAKRFRVLEAYKITNTRELATALVRGMTAVSGIGIGNNFNNLDSNGVAPLPTQIIGGHALAHIGLKKISGVWMVETQNSWSKNWGQQGYCYLQLDSWNPKYGFPFDCFAIGGVLDDPEETETDSPALASSSPTKEKAHVKRNKRTRRSR